MARSPLARDFSALLNQPFACAIDARDNRRSGM
jgi:hypothetical protein